MAGYGSLDFYQSIASTAQHASAVSEKPKKYTEILEQVRTEISENNSAELSMALTESSGGDTLKILIAKSLVNNNYLNTGDGGQELIEQLYQDMAGLGLLTQYIQDPNVEEININSFDKIEVVYSDRTEFLKEGFASPTAAIDIVKKMARMGGKLLDSVTPQIDSFIGDGTRISGVIYPIIPENCGVAAEIRKQSKKSITRKDILSSEMATEEELDFLVCCLAHKVSVGIAGGTGAGKTTDEGYLLNRYIEQNNDWNDRIFLIEDTRELNLIESKDGRFSRVIYTVTRDGPNPVTTRDLIKLSLRFHPQLIVPVEVRGAEAFEAADAGMTGHTILTSLHAPDAITAYQRLLTMCTMANSELSEEVLLKNCVAAWPIMVHKKQLRDGSRKYMQVFEATGVEHGVVQGNMLFQYITEGEEIDKNGKVLKVLGHHQRVGCISMNLFSRLCENGVPKSEIIRLFPEAAKYN